MCNLGCVGARTVGAGAEDAGEGVCVGWRGGAAHAYEERERGGEVEAAGVRADEGVVEERRDRAGRSVEQAVGGGEVAARSVGAEEEEAEVVGDRGGGDEEARVELLRAGKRKRGAIGGGGGGGEERELSAHTMEQEAAAPSPEAVCSWLASEVASRRSQAKPAGSMAFLRAATNLKPLIPVTGQGSFRLGHGKN